MKGDMGGAAAVIGAMCAISEARLKRNVVAVVAACENMISGSSYRPGDIISSMGGKSIFIGNTDAEGRLTLIDAMHYMITEEKATKLVDIATLTGAALHCTGAAASVAIASEDRFFNDVQDAFSLSGEQIWRMPIYDEYKELLKHEEADLTNTPGKPGSITAGLFIGEFTQGLPWVHIDIAGTSMTDSAKGIHSRGATGVGVRPLYYLAKS
jgi:leucyl aminopeptidase